MYHTAFSVCCRSRAKIIIIIHCPDYSFILLKEAIYPCRVPYHNSYSSSRLVHCYITLPWASKSLFTQIWDSACTCQCFSRRKNRELGEQLDSPGEERVNAMKMEIQKRYLKACFYFVTFFSCSFYFRTLIMSLTFTLILAFLQWEDCIAKQQEQCCSWTYKTCSIFFLVQLGSGCKQGFECPRTAVESWR